MSSKYLTVFENLLERYSIRERNPKEINAFFDRFKRYQYLFASSNEEVKEIVDKKMDRKRLYKNILENLALLEHVNINRISFEDLLKKGQSIVNSIVKFSENAKYQSIISTHEAKEKGIVFSIEYLTEHIVVSLRNFYQ